MPNFLFIFISEVFVFWTFSNLYGFTEVLIWYWAPTAVGGLFLLLFGRSLLIRAQVSIGQGAQFSQASLHSLTIVVGIFLLLPPFITSRALAFALILPGTRHLILWKFRGFVAKKIQQGFQNPKNGGGFRFYYKGWGPQGRQEQTSTHVNRPERDVSPKGLPASEQVIDVTPIKRDGDST